MPKLQDKHMKAVIVVITSLIVVYITWVSGTVNNTENKLISVERQVINHDIHIQEIRQDNNIIRTKINNSNRELSEMSGKISYIYEFIRKVDEKK